MPNWCEGILKVRGTKEEIKTFLLETLQPIPDGLFGQIPVEKEIKEDDWDLTIKAKNGFYVLGTHRNFIENNIEFYFATEDEIKVCVLDGFKAAWGIASTPLADLSKIYNVDLKIYAFERGMEFNQDIEIHKGEIVKDVEIEFNDYTWECVNPILGG
ncbi:hypothetical protein [Niallia circulans]|uniref:YubB ferredoxin-like domain-containing protein n=1 Tax=Niallia circulans TaxID=1397 RepID=A0A941G8S2_NIACI|nr:hypothetical protein [Niallia circulans]MCB5235468.1 hypothetical protein [Niallia circulans]